MLAHRVIPCLLLQSGSLVKTCKFSKPTYVGDPLNAVRIFNEKQVDELMLLDIDASKMRVGPNFQLVEELASECFMPLCYGGGIKSLEDASRLFSLGVEKVCIQTGALTDLNIVTKVAEKFGSQSVVVSVDVRTDWFGRRTLNSSVKGLVRQDWLSFIQNAVDAGAGEILLNSVNKDGTMSGMDLKLIAQASKFVKVPLIAAGGVGDLKDIRDGILAGADAVSVGAFFVFFGPHRAVLISYPKYEVLVDLLREVRSQ